MAGSQVVGGVWALNGRREGLIVDTWPSGHGPKIRKNKKSTVDGRLSRTTPPPKYRYRGLSLPLLSFSSFYTKDLNINKEYIHCNWAKILLVMDTFATYFVIFRLNPERYKYKLFMTRNRMRVAIQSVCVPKILAL